MTIVAPQLEPQAVPLQRARGAVDLSFRADVAGQTRLSDLREEGSFRVTFPRSATGDPTAVLLNTAGGITGGDRFSVKAEAGAGARLSITTQAAERVYAARQEAAGLVRTSLRAGAHATLRWMPQETILFDHAALDRRLDVELHPSATFLMVEPLVFGRLAGGETVQQAWLKDRVNMRVAGRPVFLDGADMAGDVDAMLMRPAIADGARAMAGVVMYGPPADPLLAPVRAALAGQGGASACAPNILVVRARGEDGFGLRRALVPVLELLTGQDIPKNWRL